MVSTERQLKTAVSNLQEQIERIRKEAYETGYAAAMRAIQEFAGGSPSTSGRKPTPAVKPQTRRSATKASAPKSMIASKSPSRAKPTRTERGSNAMLIAGVLKETSGLARAADIRKALQRSKGVAISFPSIRHALDQLAKRGEVEASADHKAWRYVANGAA
jgi:hypothetical protein